ncbi:MAG: mechanosensitive ion channel family protein [Deltaproteobacteria bacterium]|nr:mechanosensitive ion channel family protein [Deltaproteobacteria bacterium]
MANFFAGVFILAYGPYKSGDFIILESGTRGVVTDAISRSHGSASSETPGFCSNFLPGSTI